MDNQHLIESITDDIFLVRGRNGGRFPFSNSVLIRGDDGYVLVDTGCGPSILELVKKRFNVSIVVNSHTHPDHSAGNWLFKDSAKKIYVPEEGFETSGNLMALSERLAEPGPLAEYWREFVAKTMDMKDCRPTDSYSNETSLRFGQVVLIPIHTPGHTKDHNCFYEPDQKILFSFDIDLTAFGPWYGHRESSIPEFKKSIVALKQLDVRILLSGHREKVIREDINQQLSIFGSRFDERENKILGLIGVRGKTIDQLTIEAPIYGRFPYAEPLLRYWEANMIKKHLEHLIQNQKVLAKGDKYFLI